MLILDVIPVGVSLPVNFPEILQPFTEQILTIKVIDFLLRRPPLQQNLQHQALPASAALQARVAACEADACRRV